MNRKIDLGEDKNLFQIEPKALKKPQLTFLMDDLAKTADDALNDARKAGWDHWINAPEPLLLGFQDEDGKSYLFFISDFLRNKVILLDIWDYTLLPCRRSLSYVMEWNQRYSSAGLLTIGVHAPMFEFGKDKKNVLDATRELGITYPVVLDSGFDIWRSLENRYWPRRVLFDSKGKLQQDFAGEGKYDVFERNIQLALREISPGLACPRVMRPVRLSDTSEYEVPPTTPEIFFGMKRKPRFGNVQVPTAVGEEVVFKDHSGGAYAPELPYFSGAWVPSNESMYGAGHKEEIAVTVKFSGTDVYVVTCSRPKNPHDIPQLVRVQVAIDKKAVTDENRGADTTINEMRRSIVTIRGPRLYHLAKRMDPGLHELTLTVDAGGADTLELFAFFFEHNA